MTHPPTGPTNNTIRLSVDAKVGLIYGDEGSDTKLLPLVVNEDAPKSKLPGAPTQDTGKTVAFALMTSELFELADTCVSALDGYVITSMSHR